MSPLREFDKAEAVRLRRIKESFDADKASHAQVQEAIRRWNLGRTKPQPMLRSRAFGVALAAMALAGGAFAATNAIKSRFAVAPSAQSKAVLPQASANPPRKRHYVIERGGSGLQYEAPAQLTLLPGEHAAVIVDGARTEFLGPGVAEVQQSPQGKGWVTRFQPQAWVPELDIRDTEAASAAVESKSRVESAAEQPKSANSPKRVSQSLPAPALPGPESLGMTAPQANREDSLNGAWARAAVAMRRGDEVAATAALSDIAQSPDPATRDAALLARAQLDIAAGRRAQAVSVLNRLAHTGATPFVCQRAQELLVNGN